jgi:hypothetical protein
MPRKKPVSRRPRLRKKTSEESNRFWQEYAQKFQEANNSITSGRHTLPVPTLLGGPGDCDEHIWNNGTAKRERTVFRVSPETVAGERGDDADDATQSVDFIAREKAAVEEARRKAKQIMPLYNKGAYQMITEGDREALFNDGRGKK